MIARNRGRELQGNYNPLVIGELFWRQRGRRADITEAHIANVAGICTTFFDDMTREKCSEDVRFRLWEPRIEEDLKIKERKALEELGRIMEDLREYPINYNHYYTDTIYKIRMRREEQRLRKYIDAVSTYM